MSDVEGLKRKAAERAVELVEDGMRLGLGTGSTARHVLEVLAERRVRGELPGILGVPTSHRTEELARELGIPLSTLDSETHLDLTIDGADEVDPRLELVKGLGGALLWEKIVASASDRMAVVVDDRKLVARLGERSPLPVEVVPFGWRTHVDAIRDLGGEPELRRDPSGEPYRTDGGHFILDCRFADGIGDPESLDTALCCRPGVVETGLFVGLADVVVVARADGTEIRRRT